MTVAVQSSMSLNTRTSLLPRLGSSLYTHNVPRSTHQDLTPYSAVSSFNLPAQPDTNLYTPISMTGSQVIPVKTTAALDNDAHVKLSPSSMASTYDMFGDDEDFSPRYSSSPMKPKIQTIYPRLLSTSGGPLGPESPTFCTSPPVPYFGSYGVSAPSKVSYTPPSTHPSPRTQDRSPMNSSLQSYHHASTQSNNSFRPATQTPVPIAPNPQGLRPAVGYRHNSFPSNQSPPLSHHDIGYPHEDDNSNSPGRKKSQKKTEPSWNEYYIIVSTAELRAEINEQELLILDLRYKDGLPWKEVAKVYSQKYSKKTLQAALQMRKRRMMERVSIRALEIAACSPEILKWEGICKQLQRYAPKKDAIQGHKKWEVTSPYGSQYDMHLMKRERTSSDLTAESFDHDSWSDGRESTGHSLHDSDPGGLLSAISNATMDDVRDRHSSSAGLQLLQHHQQQQRQHDSILYAQQHSWGARQNS